MEKNNTVCFWRIVFMYMIAAYHFSTTFPWIHDVGFVQGWHLPVDFFFLVSGYIIYAKYEDYSKRYKTAIGFTLQRYTRLWPKYIVSFFITFAAIMLLNKNKLPAKELLWDSKFEILLLQGIGLDRGWDYINPTMWFLSVMLLADLFIFFGLRHFKKIFMGYLAPAVILLFMLLLYDNVGHLDVAVMMPGQSANYPLFRAIADMSLGMYGVPLTKLFLRSKNPKIWKMAGIAVMISAIILTSYFGHTRIDFLLLIMTLFAVSTAFLPAEKEHPFVEKWSGITLDIYFVHEVFRTHIFPYLFSRDVGLNRKLVYMVLYLIVVTVAAYIYNRIFYGGAVLWKKLKKRTMESA